MNTFPSNFVTFNKQFTNFKKAPPIQYTNY